MDESEVNTTTYDVVIQGAGPVGLACAGWLLQKNPDLRLLLLDKNSEDDASIASGDNRGIAISEGSRLLLGTLNAWPENSPAIHQVNVSQRGHFGRAVMTREEIGQTALGHIVRYADIHLALRQSLKAIQKKSSRFEWRFNADTSMSLQDKITEGCCVIHAEGGLFHEQSNKDKRHDYQQSALVGWIGADKIIPNQAWERFTPEGPLALLPNHRGPSFLNMVWCGSPAETQRRLESNPADLLSELQVSFGHFVGRFTSINDLRAYPLGLNVRNEIVVNHEVWIGNAAQTLHPVAGQGLNLGLRDAATLSGCLSPVMIAPNRHQRLLQSLKEYSRIRQGDRQATIGSTDFLARVFTSNIYPVILARGAALSALQWFPRIKSALARQMMFGQR